MFSEIRTSSFSLQGIMVVGGNNSRDKSLSTVEYLELGGRLSALRWRQLSSMRAVRQGSPLVVDGRDQVLVVGGGVSSRDSQIQRFDKNTQRWGRIPVSTQRRRFDSTYVQVPQSHSGCS